MFAIAPLGLLVLAAPMADAKGPIAGSGTLVTEVREVDAFHGISSEVDVAVDVTVGAEQRVTLTCDDNLVPHLVTAVRSGSLSLETDTDRQIEPSKGCLLTVFVPSLDHVALAGSGSITVTGEAALEHLSLSGSGDIVVQALKSADLDISLVGSGNIVGAGTVSEIGVQLSGSGDVRMTTVTAEDARVSVAGSGDVELTVQRTIDASISGSGNIEIHGEPRVHQSVVGSGVVRVHPPDAI